MFNKLKKFLKSKRAVGSVATAIKVGTACVLGAAVLVGGVALTNDIVLPNTSDKVNNVAEYEGDGTGGSTGGVTPVSVPTITTFEFKVYNGFSSDGYITYTAEDGMTWTEWCDSEYNTDNYFYDESYVYETNGTQNIALSLGSVSPNDSIDPSGFYFLQSGSND